MDNAKSKLSVVERKWDWGLYVWKCDQGGYFSDGEGHFMNIPARKGDLEAMAKLMKAARYYGAPPGAPHFMPGVSQVSDDEYVVQSERMAAGLIPSENDLGAWYDAKRAYLKHGTDE